MTEILLLLRKTKINKSTICYIQKKKKKKKIIIIIITIKYMQSRLDDNDKGLKQSNSIF